jgi:hypothetical protein
MAVYSSTVAVFCSCSDSQRPRAGVLTDGNRGDERCPHRWAWNNQEQRQCGPISNRFYSHVGGRGKNNPIHTKQDVHFHNADDLGKVLFP